MGNIASMFEGVARFFEGIGSIAVTLVKIVVTVAKLITEPHKALLYLFLWLIAIPIYTVIVVLYVFWSIPGLNLIQFCNYYFWTSLLWDLLYVTFMLALFAGLAAISIVLWIADLLTFGLVRWLTRTENSLDAWYSRPNFAFGNVAARFFIAQLPCRNRFKPDASGFICERQKAEEPSFCPQAQIYRLYSKVYEKAIGHGPDIYDDFKSSIAFRAMEKEDREQAVRTFFRSKQAFLTTCKTATAPYDTYGKAICANIDKTEIAEPADKKLLTRLCHQAHCESYTNESQSEERPPFCSILKASIEASDSEYDTSGDTDGMYVNMTKNLLYIIVVMLIAVTTIMMFQHHHANFNPTPMASQASQTG
jgi:hypothetical protein